MENSARTIDFSVRSKGSILDLLHFDIHELLLSDEVDVQKDVVRGQTHFVDYLFMLKEKEFGILDRASVRIFDDKKCFDKKVLTHLTLSSSKDVSAEDIIAIIENLFAIYGTDNSGRGDIDMYERDMLVEKRSWTGRSWYFNESHEISIRFNQSVKLAYAVIVDYDKEKGFKLLILSYNQLEDFFG